MEQYTFYIIRGQNVVNQFIGNYVKLKCNSGTGFYFIMDLSQYFGH